MSELVERLRTTLAELHAELEQLPATDQEARALLGQAAGEIQAKLDAAQASPGQQSLTEQFTEQLTTGARRFEATHPTLSRVLEDLIDMLAQMGI